MSKLNLLTLKQIGRRKQNFPWGLGKSNETGLIRQFRKALGMTLSNLADSMGVSTSTIAQAERREIKGSNLNLDTLQRVASAMNCELTYTFVPKTDMVKFVEKEAYEKAKRIIEKADLHMSLEDQKVTSELNERVRRLAEKLVNQGKVW